MKDYKPQAKSAKRKSKGNTLLGVFIGLACGLLIAVGIALYVSKIPSPFDNPAGKVVDKKTQADVKKNEVTPEQAAPEEKRFDFYRILPGQEVPVSEKELQQQSKTQSKAEEPKEPYLVQAGAFQSPTDADALKAKLALMGLESSVEPVHLQDKGTLYRVRLGPYTDLEEINHVRQALSNGGINASLVKSRKE